MVATTQTLFNANLVTATDDPVAKFDRIRNEIVAQYKADERVWVIGFSGGKIGWGRSETIRRSAKSWDATYMTV